MTTDADLDTQARAYGEAVRTARQALADLAQFMLDQGIRPDETLAFLEQLPAIAYREATWRRQP